MVPIDDATGVGLKDSYGKTIDEQNSMIKDKYHRSSAMEFVFAQSLRSLIKQDQGEAEMCRTSDTYDHHNS